VFKSDFWGIYFEQTGSLILEDNILIDNQVSLFTMIISPDPTTHVAEPKTVLIKNVLCNNS